jgi:hypothetical protein
MRQRIGVGELARCRVGASGCVSTLACWCMWAHCVGALVREGIRMCVVRQRIGALGRSHVACGRIGVCCFFGGSTVSTGRLSVVARD